MPVNKVNLTSFVILFFTFYMYNVFKLFIVDTRRIVSEECCWLMSKFRCFLLKSLSDCLKSYPQCVFFDKGIIASRVFFCQFHIHYHHQYAKKSNSLLVIMTYKTY